MKQIHCRHFSGYKPCGKSDDCTVFCQSRDQVDTSVLVVHLGALGAVARSTALLAGIKRKYPRSMITWVTEKPADQLLKYNSQIDRVLTTEVSQMLELSALEFDVALVIDKSLRASGILKSTKAHQVFGFKTDARTGAVMPASRAAVELWELGLSNHQKFFVNKKAETQLVFEALELGDFKRDEYSIPLRDVEKQAADERRGQWQMNPNLPVIGLNTGCSPVIPYKKWTVEVHREVIQKLMSQGYENIVLLGGPEDTERNAQIAQGLPVFLSPTERGLRDGLASVEACDIVITGDSLGMHMAIALKKYVAAWFGPTCAHEIDLYDRGEKILTNASCSPCWKRSCDQAVMCYDQVDLGTVLTVVHRGVLEWHSKQDPHQNASSLFRPLF